MSYKDEYAKPLGPDFHGHKKTADKAAVFALEF